MEPTFLRENPKPYYDIRRPTFLGRPLTLGLAFLCKDGIVIGADMQGTDGLGRVRSIDKTFVIENKSVAIFSYWSSEWNNLFQQFLSEREEPSHVERVRLAREEYTKYVGENKHMLTPDELRAPVFGFQGILATEEDGARRIYTFSDKAQPITHARDDKAIIGSASITAGDYIGIAELLTKQITNDFEGLVWPKLKVDFAEAFCSEILTTIRYHESSAQWGRMYVIKDGKVHRRTRDEIFEGKYALEVVGKRFLEQFTLEQYANLAKLFRLTPSYLAKAFNLSFDDLMKLLASLEESA